MFSYRHAFHAGNHADVLKHLTLVALLRYLTRKDAALTVVDTHAGAGLYRLDGDFSQKGGEAQDGVMKLFAALLVPAQAAPGVAPTVQSTVQDFKKNRPLAGVESAGVAIKSIAPALQDYLDLIASFNPDGSLRVYPGSPFVAHALLRSEARDKLKLFELHPSDSRALQGNMAQLRAGRMVAVAASDGFENLKALLPPPNKRALVLIDPSYELKTDYAQVAACVADALKRFATGSYALWYPVIPRPEAHALPRRLKTLATQAKRPWLHATLSIGAAPAQPLDVEGKPQRPGLEASGMFLINPPHTLKAQLQAALPQLVQVLGRGRGKGFGLEGG
jgi:23S rRNA (adenine2030-N6)-methyltransferase